MRVFSARGNLVFERKGKGREIRGHRSHQVPFSLNCFSDVQRKWISAGGVVLAEGRPAIENGRSHKGGFQGTYFRDVGRERGSRHVPVLCEERV